MSTISTTLAVLDMAMAAMEVATRANALLNKARAEGREVTDAELQTLIDDNKARRAAWDEAKK